MRRPTAAYETLRHVVGGLLVLLLLVLAALALVRERQTAPTADAVDPTPAAAPADPATAGPRRSERALLTDAELVYGPAVAGFETASFLRARGGSLSTYRESVGGQTLDAAALIDRVARDHAVSPRVLIALVEATSGAVDGTVPANRLNRPLGPIEAGRGLYAALGWAASWLNDGYYGQKYRGTTELAFADGTRRTGPVEAGAAHFAVARLLALGHTPEAWPRALATFAQTYDRLFGPPPMSPPPVPASLTQPPLLLPWSENERWHYTGGPHGSWGAATAWGAVDFAPESRVGCSTAPEWVRAAAPGVVVHAARGRVDVDLDGDGFVGTGWVITYLHLAAADRVAAGTAVAAGDPLGHPSCEGGYATGAHVHLARRYNGEWLPAVDGPAPLDLSGWRFTGGGREYEGTMTRAGEPERVAVTSRRAGRTDVRSDNGPARRAALSAAWAALQAPDRAVSQPATGAGAARPVEPATGGVRSWLGHWVDGERAEDVSDNR